jgi:3-hydroxyisobutyrate dehydrogenase-like beta-hydroxyacid dehydrogenase
MKIGFIGLGIMGRPMALNLMRGGHPLTVWARRAESMQPLLDAGASVRGQPCGGGRGRSMLVISMVADAPDVEQVMLGERGVASAGRSGLVAVDMSTIRPAQPRATSPRACSRRASIFSTRRFPEARSEPSPARCRSWSAAGAAFDRARPAFACMGRNIVHVGDSGAGQVAKAANQIVTGVGVLTVAEALNFAARSGVDPARVREALLGGFAYSKILENHGQRMLDRNFKPGFKSWMHQKDMNIVMQSAHELGLCLPVSAATAQMYQRDGRFGTWRGGFDRHSQAARAPVGGRGDT